jgi:hypothetical protein
VLNSGVTNDESRIHSPTGAANVPLYVDAPIKPIPAPKAHLPFVVYGDAMKDSPYVPSGYMGNTEAIPMTLGSTDSPPAALICRIIGSVASFSAGEVLAASIPVFVVPPTRLHHPFG